MKNRNRPKSGHRKKQRQKPGGAPPPAPSAAPAPREWPVALGIIAALFAVYALSAPRTVTLEDDGLFIIAAIHAGVAHPPGYPLYTLLGYLFSFIPIDPPALRIHLLSGLLGGAAAAVFYLAARLASLPRLFALSAALAYGVSEHFWAQAIIAEVYTLNALLSFSVLLFCLRAAPLSLWTKGGRHRWAPQWGAQRTAGAQRGRAQHGTGWGTRTMHWLSGAQGALAGAAFCFGLGLANHWPLMVLAFPAFAVLLLPQIALVFRRLPPLLGIALAPPVLLYGWMVLRSQQEGVISFYGPLESFQEFWYYLSRQGYGSVDASPSAGLLDKFLFAKHFFGEVFFLYTPVGAALALLGIRHLYRQGALALLAATVWIFLAHSMLLILQLGFDYEFLNLAVFRPYPLVAYGVLALWVGCGLCWAWDWLIRHSRGSYLQAQGNPENGSDTAGRFWIPAFAGMTPARIASLAAMALISILIPIILLYKNFPLNDRRADDFGARYAQVLLQNLEPDAALFVTGDLPTAPVGYLRYGEEYRADVEVLNTQGLVYPTRLFSPPTTKQNETNLNRGYVRRNVESGRPVYYTTNIVDFPNPWGSTHFGLYRQVQRSKHDLQLRLSQEMEDYFFHLIEEPKPADRWNHHLHDRLMQQFGEFIGYMALSEATEPAWLERRERMIAAMQDQYFGLIGMAEMLIKYGDAGHLPTVQLWLDKADALVNELVGETLSREALGLHSMSKEMLGRHYYRRGYLAFRQGRREDARALFDESLEVHTHPDNPSTAALDMLRQDNGRR